MVSGKQIRNLNQNKMNTQKQINNYIARQNSWIKANNIDKGTELIVFKSIKDYSQGWETCFNNSMIVPNLVTFKHVNNQEEGIACNTDSDYWYYPYNCLKVAIDPSKTLVIQSELIKMRYYVETTSDHKFIGKIEDVNLDVYYKGLGKGMPRLWSGVNIMGFIFWNPNDTTIQRHHTIRREDWQLIGMQNKVDMPYESFIASETLSWEKELEKAEIRTLRVFY